MDDFKRWAENQRKIDSQKKNPWRKVQKEHFRSYDIDWPRYKEIWETEMYRR